jgi:hypothetical protein
MAGTFQGTVCGLTALEVIHPGVKPHWFIAGRWFVATACPLSNAIIDFIMFKPGAVRPTDPAL